MATFLIVLLVLYLLISDPLLGRADHRRMVAAVRSGRESARLHFYLKWTWQSWLLMAVTLAITLGVAGWSPRRMGFAWPTWPRAQGLGLDSGSIAGFIGGVAIALVAGLVIGIVIRRRGARKVAPSGRAPMVNAAVLAMLPRTGRERWGFAALAVTAGITEEVVWRGFGLTLLFSLLPDVPPAVPIVLAAVAFGCAHFYQGAVGMLGTAVLGGILASLFWTSGSLLIPIVLHALIDLRALLVRVPADPVLGEET